MLTAAYEPLKLGPITLPNRFIKAGANENMSKQGRPTRAMRMHHEALVKGGVGMTTMAYVAVEKDGRTLPDQVWIHDDAMPDLRAVTQAVHDAGGKISAQLTHAGSFRHRCFCS
jgi:2,4-dienoyl-CoA reductase-like NADH-dependent reductase (Old Yellow Enzyme family)